MKTGGGRIRVGLVPVMIDLYRRLIPGVIGEYEKFARSLGPELSDKRIAVTCSPVVSSDRQMRAAVKEFEKQGVELLVVSHISYCESGELLPALLATKLPLLLWPAQTMTELVPAKYDFNTVLLNHGVHGTQDLASMLVRRKRPFGVLHGHYREKKFREAFWEWAQAGRMVRAMQTSNPLVIGGHFEGMLDLQMDDEPFLKRLGVKKKEISRKEFLQAVKSAKADTKAYRERFEIAKGVDEALLVKTARHEAALRMLLEKYESKAVGVNFLSLCNDSAIADGLHVGASVLMSEGVGYGGEGDWTTAMLVRGLLAVEPRSTFTEIFSVGYKDNRLVLRHWGEGNIGMARKKPILRRSTFADRIKAEFAVMDFEFLPGETTLVNLTVTPEGEGRLMSILGKVAMEHLPAVDGPRGIFKPDKNYDGVHGVLSSHANWGGSHHLGMMMDKAREVGGVMFRAARLAGWLWARTRGWW